MSRTVVYSLLRLAVAYYICCHHNRSWWHFGTIEVLVAMPMTRWEFWIVPCLAGGNASATCLKMQVTCFVNVQWPAPLSLYSMFKSQYNCQVNNIILNCLKDNLWKIFTYLKDIESCSCNSNIYKLKATIQFIETVSWQNLLKLKPVEFVN